MLLSKYSNCWNVFGWLISGNSNGVPKDNHKIVSIEHQHRGIYF